MNYIFRIYILRVEKIEKGYLALFAWKDLLLENVEFQNTSEKNSKAMKQKKRKCVNWGSLLTCNANK